jgi:ectoine hydroxylase-related dioxygenase (phytanoyl-CoA dioxygenase family)
MVSSLQTGFRIISVVLGREDLDGLAAVLDSPDVTRSRAGARHVLRHPAVHRIAHDPRVRDIAREILACDAIPFRATLFDKSPNANWLVVWHQDTSMPLHGRRDTPGWGPWSVKDGVTYAHAPAEALSRVIALRIHLDDSRLDNGPLRVLPGTHVRGVLTDETIDFLAREVQPVDCVVPAGGVIAMRPLLVHASSKSHSDRPRRVLHIEYADSLDIGDGLKLAIA